VLRIVIPARLGSTRLPGKMIHDIGGRAVVKHALYRVVDAVEGDTEIIVATDSKEVASYVPRSRARVVMTPSDCRSGSDRCAAVADIEAWPDDDVVVDVQADMPFLRPSHLRSFLFAAQAGGAWDILTAYTDLPVVELTVGGFTRKVVICHIGLYAYKRDALRRFAALPSSPGEIELRLEQMRAIENGFQFAYHALPEMPFEVNTPQDLEAAQHLAECLGW